MNGFLGGGATFWADFNLLVQAVMAMTLFAGAYLAHRKHFAAHGVVQSFVVILNLVLIAGIMLPSYFRQVAPKIPAGLSDNYYSIAFVHTLTGTVAELLGLYVILVAGTRIVPGRLRFGNYKAWMRTLLLLWWATVLLGFATYALWYLTPSSKAVVTAVQPSTRVAVTMRNFQFEPKEIAITTGTTVEWTGLGGRHTVQACDGSFQSPEMMAGGRFERRFDKPGVYQYFCANHGSLGKDMSGTITVTDPRR